MSFTLAKMRFSHCVIARVQTGFGHSMCVASAEASVLRESEAFLSQVMAKSVCCLPK